MRIILLADTFTCLNISRLLARRSNRLLCLFLKIFTGSAALDRKPGKNRKKAHVHSTKNKPSGSRRGSSRSPLLSGKQGHDVQADGIRLNRYIAQAGVCSRRRADEMIQEGKVRINGEVVTQMGVRVGKDDVVEVGGKRITPLKHEYLILNKPSNTITTNKDERGRKIILDLIEDERIKNSGVFPVGRLDRNTVGVLLVTNDGELAHRLMHPRFNIEKLYLVRTQQPVQPHELELMMKGVLIEGETYKADMVKYIDTRQKTELGIRLHEGKNRHIRRMLESLGHKTVYLERVRYAGLSAEGIRRGKWRRLTPVEIKRLRRLVKLK